MIKKKKKKLVAYRLYVGNVGNCFVRYATNEHLFEWNPTPHIDMFLSDAEYTRNNS